MSSPEDLVPTPEEPENGIEPESGLHPERREFLVKLGKMSFLTAAVVKLGVDASADDVYVDPDLACKTKTLIDGGVEGEVADMALCTAYDNIDPLCNTPGDPAKPDLGVRRDTDCGKAKSNGDQDCGKQLFKGNPGAVHKDNDCNPGGGDGTDADCNKKTNAGGVWSDDDCSPGNDDRDCGQGTPTGGSWDDNDCQKGGSDNDCKQTGPPPVSGGKGTTYSDDDGTP